MHWPPGWHHRFRSIISFYGVRSGSPWHRQYETTKRHRQTLNCIVAYLVVITSPPRSVMVSVVSPMLVVRNHSPQCHRRDDLAWRRCHHRRRIHHHHPRHHFRRHHTH